MEQRPKQLDFSVLISEYEANISAITNDLIFQKAYTKQLEKEIERLRSQLEEATTVVEYTENKSK